MAGQPTNGGPAGKSVGIPFLVLGFAFIAVAVGTKQNAFFGVAGVFIVIGIALSIGKSTDDK